MNAILSIKPEYVAEIKAGRKRFEFRKAIFKEPVGKVYIYASAPVSMVVGEFQPVDVVKGTPDEVWQRTRRYAGIQKEWYDRYYAGRDTAYAIEIKNLVHYDSPVNPYVRIAGFHAPQSFCYIDEI